MRNTNRGRMSGQVLEPHEVLDPGMSGFFEDAARVGKDLLNSGTQEGQKALKDKAAAELEKAIRSSEFGKVLDMVEAKARQGVIEESKKNATNLMLFAVAGGAIGGVVASKFGSPALLAAVALGIYAGAKMLGKV